MLTIILFLLVGSILAYLSQFNLTPVTVNFGIYTLADVPLFYVIIGSLALGLLFSYLINLVHSVSMSFLIRGKKKEIKKYRDEVLELTKRVHQLELEKEKLKHEPSTEPEDLNAL
ncbi:MAG: hypothetical protein UT13_C0001G0337 [Candidatus Pacebacteria bacterium GW2011_GWF2_38_9]|nr:MAG: hypothetical protein US01_C0001G0345 [candidate division TM6 bacterium GW2011_GWF2_28_16]KKQ88690.1 MAG: hypothetical protein UT13_C0001G0337 [Candidatus Pacebacteria bacterium GW2011_GWF2_38_9]MBU1033648.1 DUF1049 domain-containing protein [Patescibacteria group bacterium]